MMKLSYLYSIILLTASMGAWSKEAPLKKISSTGAVFTLNLDYPELGNAYQDESGLIWGDLVLDHNTIVRTDAASAEAHCESIGARLPTVNEYKNLAKYLGAGTRGGYSPETMDKSDFILLGLPFYWYWTSSPYRFGPKKFQYIFWGESGATESGARHSKGGAIHCVVQG